MRAAALWSNQPTSLSARRAIVRVAHSRLQTVRSAGLITVNDILAMQATFERNQAGFRRLPGTALKNDKTGEVVFTPPQSYDEIVPLMANLEAFIKGGEALDLDPLVKMAVAGLWRASAKRRRSGHSLQLDRS
jgi:Fic family protein